MGDVPVLTKFNKLVRDPFGGFSDFYSREQRIKLENLFERVPWQRAERDDPTYLRINKQIEQTKKEIPRMTGFFRDSVDNILKTENKNDTKLSSYDNLLPYGDARHLMSLDTERMKQLDLEYIYLFKNLYPQDYQELEDSDDRRNKILSDACGSMGDWPKIDPKSIGLGGIEKLEKLFNKHYFGYQDKIDKKQFYNDFLKTSFLNDFSRKINNNSRKYPDINEKIEDMFMFDTDIWYGDDNEFKFYKADSFGCTFAYNQAANQEGNEIKYNRDTGFYEWDGFAHLTFKLKSACVLFQKGMFQNEYKISESYRGDYTTITASNPPTLLQLLYNVRKEAFLTYTADGDKIYINGRNEDKLFKQNSIKSSTVINEQFKLPEGNKSFLSGGSRKKCKKMKGGSEENAFDNNTAPCLLAGRRGMEFNPEIFSNSLKKFKELNDYNINITSENLPVFYHSRDETIAEIKFEDIRKAFLISSVIGNTYKLYIHFFKNLKACYEFYLKNEVSKTKNKISNELGKVNRVYRDVNMESFDYFVSFEEGIKNLIKKLDNLIGSLKTNIIYSDESYPDLTSIYYFLGLNLQTQEHRNFGEAINPLVKIVDTIEYSNNDDMLILNGTLFTKIMKDMSKHDDMELGGLPFGSVYVKRTLRMWSVFYLLLRWRELSNETLNRDKIRYLNNASTKLTETEEMLIRSSVDRDFTYEKIKILGDPSQDHIEEKKSVAKFIFMIFYNKSIEIAKKIAEKHKIINKRIDNQRHQDFFISQLPHHNISRLTQPEMDINKEIDKFEYMARLFYDKLWNIMKPDMNPNLSTQFLFIVSRVSNMIQRVKYVNKGIYDISKNNKKKLLNRSGFKLNNLSKNINQNALREGFEKMLTTQLENPNFNNSQWWASLEDKFNIAARNTNTNSNILRQENKVNKLFVIAVKPKLNNQSKVIGADGVYLIDVFRAAQANNIIISDTINVDTIQKNSNKEFVYRPDNAVINLTGYLKRFGEKHKGNILEQTKGIKERFKRIPLKQKRSNEDQKLWEILKTLIEGNLMGYVIDREDLRDVYSKKKINPLFLQESTNIQLMNVLQANNNIINEPDFDKQYKVYLINDDMLKDGNTMRKWCYELLFSMPNSFTVDNSLYKTTFMQSIGMLITKKDYMYIPLKTYYKQLNPFTKDDITKLRKLAPNVMRRKLLKTVSQGQFVSRDTILNMGLLME